MKTAFLSDDRLIQPVAIAPPQPNPDQEQLQLILVSNPDWVTATIHELHRLSFAEATAWSRLLPTAHPGQVISILTRHRRRP